MGKQYNHIMQAYLFPIIISFFLSFLINYFTNKDLLISLFNSVTLGLSIYLFRHHLRKGSIFNYLLIIFLGLIPLFHYAPANYLISLLPLASLGMLYLYRGFFKKWALILWAFFLLLGSAYSGEIIKYPFNVQHTQIIFNSPEINYHIQRHQQDALFLPFKARQIIYSKLIIVYAALNNFFDFLNLKNLYDILLIANLYPLIAGCYKIFMKKNELRNICLMAFMVTIITGGIDRSPDKFQSLYLLGPILIYLIILGAQTINKKLYLTLWLLSIFILISPKI